MRKLLYTAAAFALILAVASGARARNNKSEIARNLSIFSGIYKELQLNYIDTVDPTATMRTAIDAMLARIDPYTEFYSADDQEEILSVSSGEYAGIGSTIQRRDSIVVLSDPRWDSPARRAGVRHGDIILAVDDVTITPTMPVSEVSSKLRGQPGTHVRLKLRRPYVKDSLLTVDITRGTISIDPVPYYGYIGDGIGYIRLTTFNEKTASKFARALADLRKNPEVKSLVIDLRGNGGGLLESAVQIVGNFVPKGTSVVETRGRDPKQRKTYKTTHTPVDTEMPVAVLIDGGTASAAEIVSGSLQDLDRAVIIGERSYGKGLVQNVRPMPYNSLMKITTGRYYIPSGRLIQAVVYNHDGSADNQDGAQRIPDSLTTAYPTAHGRIVRDGGGITPDSTIATPEMNRLMYNLIVRNVIEDYANRYANTHAAVTDSTWVLPDSLFNDFKASMDRGNFKYELPYDSGIKFLRDAARLEGYLTDSLSSELDRLSAMLRPDLERDLDMRRDEILDEMDRLLSERWFSEGQVVRRSLEGDSVLTLAREVLTTPGLYNYMLSPKFVKGMIPPDVASFAKAAATAADNGKKKSKQNKK